MKLESLDHVALAVRNVENSVKWYREVLGLKRQHAELWDNIPIFLGAGATAIALFPAETELGLAGEGESSIRMLHFAWRTDRENFAAAQTELKAREIAFHFEDHGIAHSIYFRDPDGHRLEITTYEVG